MSEQARACAAYFRSRPGYRRILEQLLKKEKEVLRRYRLEGVRQYGQFAELAYRRTT